MKHSSEESISSTPDTTTAISMRSPVWDAVKEILTMNDRSRLIISTKAGTVVPSASIIPTPRAKQKNFSPDHIEQSCTNQ